MVGERHDVTDDEFDACRTLQVLDPVHPAVTCGNVDVINSIVGDNLAATI